MKERDIFVAALAITDIEERDAYLNEACSEPGRKEHLRALLEAEAKLGTFLESPARATGSTGVDEGPGTTIGPYKLLEQIGEGGMGVVFMAEQTRTVRRRVALKVIKPGLDTRQIIARFEAERQALALMEHPNIARVLDAGTTDSGRPYFVMELVAVCRSRNTATRIGWMPLGDSATVLAGNRGTDPKRLAKLLAGDLDWIMMKALEQDRNRRYAAAGDFAADIEQFLRHEGVVARPPSAIYRLSRLAQQNRGAVLAATVTTLALVAGTAVATRQAIAANLGQADRPGERSGDAGRPRFRAGPHLRRCSAPGPGQRARQGRDPCKVS